MTEAVLRALLARALTVLEDPDAGGYERTKAAEAIRAELAVEDRVSSCG
jgi:hypothetical protein